ncbi:hypothetical protein J8281_09665 [Aquimarina sp. U1-2]|uniref:hypothetical protein n=1 Tax=Aquimarina sp. U1-2 TaxID=2823141 RepID=UPI001AEC9E77|nr:hypothetical protein [Aquimarina sp. U1-2]MBP2832451.1 hypothetical protein [Aquimarina sp. U1-2]
MKQEDVLFDEYERLIINKLKDGFTQVEISKYLKKHNIEPYSLRSIEHRINALKKRFEAKTLISLVYILTKKGLI